MSEEHLIKEIKRRFLHMSLKKRVPLLRKFAKKPEHREILLRHFRTTLYREISTGPAPWE